MCCRRGDTEGLETGRQGTSCATLCWSTANLVIADSQDRPRLLTSLRVYVARATPRKRSGQDTRLATCLASAAIEFCRRVTLFLGGRHRFLSRTAFHERIFFLRRAPCGNRVLQRSWCARTVNCDRACRAACHNVAPRNAHCCQKACDCVARSSCHQSKPVQERRKTGVKEAQIMEEARNNLANIASLRRLGRQ